MDSVIIDLTGAGKELKKAVVESMGGRSVVIANRVDLPDGSNKLAINVAGATSDEMFYLAQMMITMIARTCPYGETNGIKSVIVSLTEDLLGEGIFKGEGESG